MSENKVKKTELALKVENLSKEFRLPHEKHTSLKGSVLGAIKGNGYEIQKAVNDVSFEIKKGEFFGIVGRNGSGKSTLLKCIAGVYFPTKGKVTIKGSLIPFIELGVGFNPDLSGRDNVYLNGSLLGFSRKEMEAMYDDIVDFAELSAFMDQKLKNYSSGMQVRLAFSIAIRANGDILLLDEVLAVGDAAFQQKCFDYFASLKRSNKTIILVSHSMPMIERFCERAILMENGVVTATGTSSHIAGVYEEQVMKEEAEKQAERDRLNGIGDASAEVQIDAKVEIHVDGKKTKNVETQKEMEIVVTQTSKVDMEKVYFGLNMRNTEGLMIMAFDTRDKLGEYSLKAGKPHVTRIKFKNYMTNGLYQFTLGISDASDTSEKALFKKRNLTSFSVFGVRKHEVSTLQVPYEISAS